MADYKIANDLLSKQLSWVIAADNKVPPIFAINTAMLGVIAALSKGIENWSISHAIVSVLAALPLVGSIISLALATFPRLHGPKGSNIYFGGIITKNLEAYVSEMKKTKDDDLLEDMYRQVYRNAEIAQAKFTFIKWAMIQTFSSIPFWLISIWKLYC